MDLVVILRPRHFLGNLWAKRDGREGAKIDPSRWLVATIPR